MSSYTPRFGFSFFGGGTPGSLSDDGAKFTADDRLTLDKILAAFEQHSHDGGDVLPDPGDAPTGVLSTTDGGLPADKTYYYVVSFLDQYGLETRASSEVAIDTPAKLTEPGAPAVEASAGGTLPFGLYYYAVSALNEARDETQLSAPTLVGLTEGDGTALLTLPAMPAGGTEFRVWRQGPGQSGFTKLGLTNDITFLDDGSTPNDPCACDPSNYPPAINTTNSTNSITITLSDADAAAIAVSPSPIKRWRLYRSDISGTYTGQSLVHEVVETENTDGTGTLLLSWTDDGSPLLAGSPQTYSQTLAPSKQISGGGGGGALSLNLSTPVLDDAGQPTDVMSSWKVIATTDGLIQTRQTTATGKAVLLTAPGGGLWQLGITTDGALTTTLIEDERPAGALVYSADGPVVLPTPDPTYVYALTVSDDGQLATQEA